MSSSQGEESSSEKETSTSEYLSSTKFKSQEKHVSRGKSSSVRTLYPPRFWSNSDCSRTHVDYMNRSTSASGTEKSIQHEPILKKEPHKKSNVKSNHLCLPDSAKLKSEDRRKPFERLHTQIELPIKSDMVKQICFYQYLKIRRENKDQFKKKKTADRIRIYPELMETNASDQIGTMHLCVEECGENIIVNATSQFSYEGQKADSHIISRIDRNFANIEERKREALYSKDNKEEKNLHVFRDRNDYATYSTSSSRNTTKRRYGIFNFQQYGDFVLDGAGLALMRYLVCIEFKGIVKTLTLNINGQICRVVYKVGKPKIIVLDSRPYNLVSVVKLLFTQTDASLGVVKKEISKSYYFPTGHLVHHCWANCPYFIHIDTKELGRLCHRYWTTRLESILGKYGQMIFRHVILKEAEKEKDDKNIKEEIK